jgi:hypothetical protein
MTEHRAQVDPCNQAELRTHVTQQEKTPWLAAAWQRANCCDAAGPLPSQRAWLKLAKVLALTKESTIAISNVQSEITELLPATRLETNQDGC